MGRSTMVTEIQCRIYAAECERLGVARDISIQRATALMAMANSWQRLAADTGGTTLS
jgi:RecB family exonuclease